MLIRDAILDYSQHFSPPPPVFNSRMSHIQRGYLNANVSMHQTEGTAGSANRKPPLLSQRWRRWLRRTVRMKEGRVLLKGLET